MLGMNAQNGTSCVDVDHLQQSIRDILTTPIGSRVMRRHYGSRLLELLDAPCNEELKLDLYAATAEALEQWEPRFQLENIEASFSEGGKITLFLNGIIIPSSESMNVSIEL